MKIINVFKRHISIFVLLALVPAIYGLLLIITPLPLNVIDRDRSGVISFGEALDTIDVGKRPSDIKQGCIEYFWYKDGLLAYDTCQKPST
jgi:hypothetical protein